MAKKLSFHPALPGDITSPVTLDFGSPLAEQVIGHLRGLGDLRGYDEVILPGQAVAAILALPVLEMACGLPVLTLYAFGPDRSVEVGRLAVGDYRQNTVRPRRAELAPGGASPGYTVFDGAGRGLTPVQHAELATQLGCEEEDIHVLDLAAGHVNFATPTEGMAEKVIATGVTFKTLTSGRVLYIPAGSGLVAALQAVTINGLGEAWPRVIRLNREADGQFHVAEVCDAHALRQVGAQLGASWRAGEAPVLVPRDLFNRVVAALGDSPEAGELRSLVS
jgi:hypothetical protein